MSDMETRLREALQVLADDVSGQAIQPDDLAALRSHQQRRRAAVAAVAAAALLVGAVVAGLSTVNRSGALDAPSAGSPTPSGSATISIYRSPSVSPIPSITSVKSIIGAVEPIDRYCPGAPTVGTSWYPGNGQPAHITTLTVPNAIVGEKYQVFLQSTVASSVAFWGTARGRQPFGLGLWSDGRLSGTPESVGTFCFSAVVYDRTGYATQPYIIIVTKASAP